MNSLCEIRRAFIRYDGVKNKRYALDYFLVRLIVLQLNRRNAGKNKIVVISGILMITNEAYSGNS